MGKTFLKQLGLGAIVAVLTGLAAYFAAPDSYAALGLFAGAAATVGQVLAEVLKKLAEKVRAL